MHSGTLVCCACEKATGGAEPAGLAAAFGDATAEADGRGAGSLIDPVGWQPLSWQVESGMCSVTAMGASVSYTHLTLPTIYSV